jgi:hypothetical protein
LQSSSSFSQHHHRRKEHIAITFFFSNTKKTTHTKKQQNKNKEKRRCLLSNFCFALSLLTPASTFMFQMFSLGILLFLSKTKQNKTKKKQP